MRLKLLFPSLMMTSLWANAENLRPFHSDGCSTSPDSLFGKSFIHCCVAHDFDYWVGGTERQKNQADESLKQCIQATMPHLKVIATIYELGVVAGGKPHFLKIINSPFYWRWGYGWETNHGYSAVTKEELLQGLGDLQKMESNLEDQQRALNETHGFAWRFSNLNISNEQFGYIREILREKINNIADTLN
jgi:hypothetical protein